MSYTPERKRKRPTIWNLLIKKRRRMEDDCFCEVPLPQDCCLNISYKLRNFSGTLVFATLLLYCMMLGYILKGRISNGRDLGIFRNNIPQLMRRNHVHDEFNIKRKILEAVPSAETHKETHVVQPVKQIKLSDLKATTSNRFIASVSSPTLLKKSMSAFGAWMKDPTSSDDVIYVMDYYFRNTHVLAYESEKDFTSDAVADDYVLPVQWGGTGHTVYNGNLYFNRYNSSTLCKYSLSTRELVMSKNLPNAGFGNMSPYQWAGSTDIDFAADKDGLFVIYATPDSTWNITISKLNPDTLEAEETWVTNYRKRSAANAFMANGVLYTLHRYDAPDTLLNYAFDTSTSTYFWPKIPFEIKFGSVASLDYDSREQKLYAWDRGHQVTYDVTFK